MTENDIGTLRADLNDLKTCLAREMGEIKSLIATESIRCPYREIISKASDDGIRLKKLEEDVHRNQLDAAKAGATGGGVVGVIGLVVFVIVKTQGWL